MASGQKISGTALASVFAGSLFLYAGIRGKSVLASFQSVVQGKSPAGAAGAAQIGGTPAADTGGAVTGSGAPSAGSYDHASLMTLWQQAGGSSSTANNAACHAMQESGGRPAVTSSNPDGGTNVGLWQLDTPGGKGAGYTVSQLQNALMNARITVMATRNGADWSAWATPGC